MTSKREIEAAVRDRFARLARSPDGPSPFPVGAASAKALGYEASVIDELPPGVAEAFAGVGNPLGLSSPAAGERVLDLGCGCGLDALLAARSVGPRGSVVGVDFTEAMVEKARRNAHLAGVDNVEFVRGDADDLPVRSATVDRLITNGVFNLCFDKKAVVREMHRVLRPGGRLQMADVFLDERVTPEELARLGEWSA